MPWALNGVIYGTESESRDLVSNLDLPIDISNGDLICSIFDKRDTFDFDIVNFPDLPGNIPTTPAHGTYISQLIRYSRACHNYDNFSLDIPCLQKDFQSGFFCEKTNEKILQIHG